MIQSPMFDGKMPNWFHYACFFGRNRVKTTADIKNFDQLRWEDQEKIKVKIVPKGAGGVQSGVDADDDQVKDYSIEVAKSARSICRGCEAKIAKGAVRISKKDYESENAKRFGPVDRWYHLQCFANNRDELEFFASGTIIPGFGSLSIEDQDMAKKLIPEIQGKGTKRSSETSEGASKKAKTDNKKEEKLLKAQNKLIFEYRDKLQQQLNKKQLQLILEHNEQEIPSGESKILDRLADCFAFGALLPCPECKGQLALGTGGYRCHGNLTEWTKCTYTTKTPKRQPFVIPEELELNFPLLQEYKYVARERVFPSEEEKPSVVEKSSDQCDGQTKKKLPLSGMRFVINKTEKSKADLTKAIGYLGGSVVSKVDEGVMAVISTQADVEKMSSKIVEAKRLNIHVITEDFVEAAKEDNVLNLIKEKNICSWGGDLTPKLKNTVEIKTEKKENRYEKSGNAVKVTMSGSSPVDSESGLESQAHVLESKGEAYNAVLGLVDVAQGTNSYYRLQILESNSKNKYWVFRAWGRIGTTIGGTKLDKMEDKVSAVAEFKRLYEEKTGNCWSDRRNFVKYPKRFYPMELDYGTGASQKCLKDVKSDTPSKLAAAVQDLICMIFDVDTMKKAMVEFEIDLKKMPLGKISRRQIEKAYGVLTELQQLVQSKGTDNKFLDASNRFYTLIPHDFGMKKPPLLNTEDIIRAKIGMLDSLLEIEIAYSILQDTEGGNVHPIDAHYEKLNTGIEILEKEAEEYKLMCEYTANTHAATHSQYSLDVEEIFKINRHGEAKRYKPFKKLPNRALLWHGSRITNFVGILSQGLRIAPPEAPVTGYMFGKGIYFADMVSKSANYCFATKKDPYGLLLLCEVALGSMHELKRADFVTKLPPGKHSTKGVGATYPNAAQQKVTEDGVIVPCGKPVTDKNLNSSLLYNEYIVYDVAQVQVKYLLKVKFNWKF